MHLSLISSYFSPLWPKYIFQSAVIEQPELLFYPQYDRLSFKLCRAMRHNKWIPATMEWRVFWLRVEKQPPIRTVAANILNKQVRTTDKVLHSTVDWVRC